MSTITRDWEPCDEYSKSVSFEQFNSEDIRFTVDKGLSRRVASHNNIGLQSGNTFTILLLMKWASLPLGIVLAFFFGWISIPVAIVIGYILKAQVQRVAINYVVEGAKTNKQFYDVCIKHQILNLIPSN